MKRFANVKSKLSQMWDKENTYLEKRGYISPIKARSSSELPEEHKDDEISDVL